MQTNKITEIDKYSQQTLKRNILDTTSRYQESDFIYYGKNSILTLSTYERIINTSSVTYENILNQENIKYYVITKGTQYKPYLASQEIYGDVGYWWFLMESNNIFDIENFTAGKTLKVLPINLTRGF